MNTQSITATIDPNDVMTGVIMNIELVHYRRWRLRLRIGMCLIRVACWVLGCSIHVDEEGEK